MSTDGTHSSYVDRVRDDTQKYIRKLIADNEQLSVTVARLESDLAVAQKELATARTELSHRHAAAKELEVAIERIRAESERYLAQYAEVETNNTNLANLYVASYQLHGTLRRDAVLGAMQEIIINLIGSEEFAICEVGEAELIVVAAVGVEPGRVSRWTPRVADVISNRILHVGAAGDRTPDEPLVCIPLQLDGVAVGVIVIFNLLAHKSQLEPLDHELFDLLATHAATALYCTSLHERITTTAAAS